VVTSEWLSEHGAAVIVEGDLDLDTAPLLATEIERQISEGHRHLVVDLTSASFLDSTSMGALLRSIRPLCDEPGAAVVIAGAGGIVARGLRTSGIDQLFTMFGTRDEAARGLETATGLREGWRAVRARNRDALES
jgi:anti-anti-sigma factor